MSRHLAAESLVPRQVRPLTAGEATVLGVAAAAVAIAGNLAATSAQDPWVEGRVVALTTAPQPPIPRMCLVRPHLPCPDPQPAVTVVVVERVDGTTVTRTEPAPVATGCTTGAVVRYDTGCEARP